MNLFKQITGFVAAFLVVVTALTGCQNTTQGFDPTQAIGVISREDGSGTRSAFVELFGVEQKNDAGEKVDYTTLSAIITKDTSVMMTTVSGDMYAMGYISLGSLNDTVKAISIDGVAPTVENILNGEYTIARPFNIVTGDNLSPLAEDFIRYILSADGQSIVAGNNYIPISDGAAYEVANLSGKLVISGSSSVTPVMEKLKEGYEVLNPAVTIEIQQSDSSTGISDTIDGTCQIGMASRELKEAELAKGVTATAIALDGIAVIVNNQCPISDLTSAQVQGIFMGEITTWAELE